MKALVVYESIYGNTAAIGEAIADSLRSRGLGVTTALVSKIDPASTTEFDLVVVGGPTHVHGMSSSRTRSTAAGDETNTFPEPTLEPGLRTWLKQLPSGTGRLAGAFDTRIDKPVLLTGSAAKGIGRRLKGRGFRLVSEPASFFVSTENVLLGGEIERATAWGGKIAEHASSKKVALA